MKAWWYGFCKKLLSDNVPELLQVNASSVLISFEYKAVGLYGNCNLMMHWCVFAVTVIAALLLTGQLRRYALSRCLLDVPNGRSSHTMPTPRGGGVAIVLTFLGGLSLLQSMGFFTLPVVAGIFGAGGAVALVGFVDDHGHIPARWRLLAHFVAAGWALAWLGGLPSLIMVGVVVDLGWVGHLLALLYMVWLLNLYNFMDGIDGIAGIEAVTVCLGGALVYIIVLPEEMGWALPILLLAAVLGFLFWNFPYAKIFMGDGGSGFLGLMMGILSIHAANASPELFWCWLILLGVFIVDATVTLVRRVIRRQKFYHAHRSHAYQYASRQQGAHWRVSLVVGGINMFWLLPFAGMVAIGWLDGAVGVLVSYVPLILLAIRYKAGAVELQSL